MCQHARVVIRMTLDEEMKCDKSNLARFGNSKVFLYRFSLSVNLEKALMLLFLTQCSSKNLLAIPKKVLLPFLRS